MRRESGAIPSALALDAPLPLTRVPDGYDIFSRRDRGRMVQITPYGFLICGLWRPDATRVWCDAIGSGTGCAPSQWPRVPDGYDIFSRRGRFAMWPRPLAIGRRLWKKSTKHEAESLWVCSQPCLAATWEVCLPSHGILDPLPAPLSPLSTPRPPPPPAPCRPCGRCIAIFTF